MKKLLSFPFHINKKIQNENDSFYSICFQSYVSSNFYSQLIQKIFYFAKIMDDGTPTSREHVWRQFKSLLGISIDHFQEKENYFIPFLISWLQQSTINIFGLELLYISFILNTFSNYKINSSKEYFIDSFTIWNNNIPSILLQFHLVKKKIFYSYL